MSALVCVVDASVAIELYLAKALSAEAQALFFCLSDPVSMFHAGPELSLAARLFQS